VFERSLERWETARRALKDALQPADRPEAWLEDVGDAYRGARRTASAIEVGAERLGRVAGKDYRLTIFEDEQDRLFADAKAELQRHLEQHLDAVREELRRTTSSALARISTHQEAAVSIESGVGLINRAKVLTERTGLAGAVDIESRLNEMETEIRVLRARSYLARAHPELVQAEAVAAESSARKALEAVERAQEFLGRAHTELASIEAGVNVPPDVIALYQSGRDRASSEMRRLTELAPTRYPDHWPKRRKLPALGERRRQR
jgi:hypothetical protein